MSAEKIDRSYVAQALEDMVKDAYSDGILDGQWGVYEIPHPSEAIEHLLDKFECAIVDGFSQRVKELKQEMLNKNKKY